MVLQKVLDKLRLAITFFLLVSSLAIVQAAAVELPDTNRATLSMNPSATVKVYETTLPGYYQYINGRFGFTIDFPTELSIAMKAGNNGGVSFFSPDRRVELSVWGSHNTQRTALSDEYWQRVREVGSDFIAYKSYGDDWYVISWAKGGKIYYEKGFVSYLYRNVFTLSYPIDLREQYDHATSTIEQSFTPGWKSGRKIWG